MIYPAKPEEPSLDPHELKYQIRQVQDLAWFLIYLGPTSLIVLTSAALTRIHPYEVLVVGAVLVGVITSLFSKANRMKIGLRGTGVKADPWWWV